MKFYSIAGVTVGFETKYELTEKRSRPYLCKESGFADFIIKLDYNNIEKKALETPLMTEQDWEYMQMGSNFYRALLEFGGFMLHASAVVVDGQAYCFSAHSGTGKSTHTSLWLELFKDRGAFLINDDKPAIKLENGRFMVYGTPFSGKHDLNKNTSVPLKAICFIERAETNSITLLKPAEVFSLLLNQTIRPAEEAKLDKLCELIDKLLTDIPVYKLKCNISLDAAQLAYNEMSGSN